MEGLSGEGERDRGGNGGADGPRRADRQALIERLFQDSVAKVPAIFSSSDRYIRNSLDLTVERISEWMQTAIESLGNLHFHQVKHLKEIDHPIYFLDMRHKASICDGSKCPTIRKGDVLLLDTQVPVPGRTLEDVSFAIAIEDEDERYHTGFKVQVTNMSKDSVDYMSAAYLRVNVQCFIECWLSGHAAIERSPRIINAIIQDPDEEPEICGCSDIAHAAELPCDFDQNLTEVVMSLGSSLFCNHKEHIKILKGSQGMARTKVLAALLVSHLQNSKCLVFASSTANINELLNGLHAVGLSDSQWNSFCEKIMILERTSDLGDFGCMSLESRVKEANRFLGSPGWRYFFNVVGQVAEHCKTMYKLIKEGEHKTPKGAQKTPFLKIFKDEFVAASKQLKDCIIYLQSRVPDLNVEDTNEMIKTLDEMKAFLDHPAYDASVKEPKKKFDSSTIVHNVLTDLNKKRKCCINSLKKLKGILASLTLPVFKTEHEVKEFCIRNSNLIFCSIESSLSDIIHHEAEYLIIDNADLIEEEATLAPLCMPSIKSIILAFYSAHANCRIIYAVFFLHTQLKFDRWIQAINHHLQRRVPASTASKPFAGKPRVGKGEKGENQQQDPICSG